MAATQPPQREKGTFHYAVFLHSLRGIDGTGRIKTTGQRYPRRKNSVIAQEAKAQNSASDQNHYCKRLLCYSCTLFSSSFCTRPEESAAAPFLAITTISEPGIHSWRWRRKNSRTSLLIRFRSRALPTLPLTVIPNLLSPCSLLLLITMKLGE
jgi:hypothetical protein